MYERASCADVEGGCADVEARDDWYWWWWACVALSLFSIKRRPQGSQQRPPKLPSARAAEDRIAARGSSPRPGPFLSRHRAAPKHSRCRAARLVVRQAAHRGFHHVELHPMVHCHRKARLVGLHQAHLVGRHQAHLLVHHRKACQ